MKFSSATAAVLAAVLISSCASAASDADAPRGNTKIGSFQQSKQLMLPRVYSGHRVTLYCGAEFDAQKNVKLPSGFYPGEYRDNANVINWEHIVPAENFGRNFSEWTRGAAACTKKGHSFKGRKCASKENREFRFMEADMHNLYPAIGAVNTARQSYDFTEFEPGARSTFGSCQMKVRGNKAEPPERSRGIISRAYLYMDWAYPAYTMDKYTKALMNTWNEKYPVSDWECERDRRIARVQGNHNPFVQQACRKR